MIKKYRIQTNQIEQYPFGTEDCRLPNFHYEVTLKFQVQNAHSFQMYYRKIKTITDLQLLCSALIKLYEIVQKRSQQHFLLVYEHVHTSLVNVSEQRAEMIKVQVKIRKLCEFLLQKRIKPKLEAKYFGVSENNQIKYLLLPNYEQIQDETVLKDEFQSLQERIKSFLNKLSFSNSFSPRQTIQDDKTSQKISDRDLSAYNKKFQEKISLIESKLQIKSGSNEKTQSGKKLRRRKKMSKNLSEQHISGSSSSQNSLKKQQNKVKIYVNKVRKSWNNERQNNLAKTLNEKKLYQRQNSDEAKNQHSYSNQKLGIRDKTKQKQQKLTNSLIIEQNNQQMQKLKQHKSSFGDYSNYDSQKSQKLKRRIGFALEKSRYALDLYAKYQSKRASCTNKN